MTGLIAASAFARQLLPHAPHAAAFVFDLDLRLCFADGEALRRRDFDPASLVGRLASEALPPSAWDGLRPLYERAIGGEEFIVEFEGVNGRHYRIHGSPVLGPSAAIEGGLLVSHEMVTPAEERLTERLRQQSAVAELGKLAITGGVDLDSLMEEAASLVSATLKTDGVGITELLPGGTEFLVRLESSGRLTGLRVALAGSLPGAVLEAGRPLIVVDSERADHPISAPLAAMGMRSVVCVPIGHIDDPFGILGAFSRRVAAFAEEDARFLESIAFVLAEAAQREQVDAELRRQALHDVVTGLPNRTLLEDRLIRSLAVAGRAGLRVAVLFVDLDRFKVVNDSLGHHAGDQALQAVADRLRSAVRRSDTVARFGGDEFVIVATAIESERDAERIAESVLSLLAAPVMIAEQQVYVRASIGIALSGPDGDADPLDLIRAADAALYRAKARGRGRYELDDADVPDAATNQVIVEQDLRQGLADGDLRLVFQPFVSLGDGSTVGAEVLLRWQHPVQGYLEPAAFLDVAERSGLIVPIGEWMLYEACRRAVRWSLLGDFLLTVNLSAGQLADPYLVEAVRSAVELSGLDPGCLGLELTEQVLIGDEADMYRTLTQLKDLGVKLLLDDFGTGFSSLSHLKRFPIDIVKIDRSFVEGLGASTGPGDDAAIVSALVSMSRATGKQVIPEGIETETQVAELRRLGCELGQGYRFSRPMEVDDFDAWIDSAAVPGTSP